MSYSRNSSKTTFISSALLTFITSLASWQFYEYATFKHDNGLLNIEGGVRHLAVGVAPGFLGLWSWFFPRLKVAAV